MEESASTPETTAPALGADVTGIAFASVYVDDFEKAYAFYSETIGLEKQYDMGVNACFFKVGAESGLYVEGGNHPLPINPKSVRSAFTLQVGSTSAFYHRLREAGVKIVQTGPTDMGGEMFWFQFYDPAGNIVEALGGR
jgi:predicted enzyme related to lactoylglutathione lyase